MKRLGRTGSERGQRRALRLAVTVLLALTALVAAPGGASAAPNRLDMSGLPESPWGYLGGGPGAASFRNGIWTTDTGPRGFASQRLEYPNGEWNAMVQSALGWAVEVRLRVDPLSADDGCSRTNIWANDFANLVKFGFGKQAVCMVYPNNITVPLNTTGGFHTYRFEVRRQSVTIRVDGVQRAQAAIAPGGGGSQFIGFGDFGESDTRQVLRWDSFSYDVSVGNPACTLVGTALADTLVGTPGADNICAGRGDDVVHGGAGNDSLVGSLGRDRLQGEGGNDSLFGGDGADTLVGGSGTDRCFGGSGTDTASSCESITTIP